MHLAVGLDNVGIEADKGGPGAWVGGGWCRLLRAGGGGEQTGTQGRAARVLFPHVKFEMLRGHLSGNISK